MVTHINKTCQSAYYHLYNIRKIRKFLSYDRTKHIVQSVIMSRIDYCNSLLYGIPEVHLGKLQRMQNSAARLISFTSRYDHITPVLIDLHWLSVPYSITYKVAVMTFKAVHNLARSYIKELVKIKPLAQYHL